MTAATGTDVHRPTTRASDEADSRQLKLAKAEGEKYLAALDYMAKEVAETGGKTRAGDYVVAFAQEKAEGMYQVQGGQARMAGAR